MRTTVILFLLSIFSINSVNGQVFSERHFFQLQGAVESLPFFLSVEKDSFYFFSYDIKEQEVNLLNYGLVRQEGASLNFEASITAEGTTIVYEFFGSDSIYCYNQEYFVSTNGDTTPYKVYDNGIYGVELMSKITNVKASDYGINSNLILKNRNKRHTNKTILPVQLLNSCHTISKDLKSIVIQDQVTQIESTEIIFSEQKPHLVLVDMYYPRQRGGGLEPYYFFPQAKNWSWDKKSKLLKASKVEIINFFDFETEFFNQYFNSKKGVYKSKEWTFKQITKFEDAKRVLNVLQKQKIKYLEKRKPKEPIHFSSQDALMTVRKIPNKRINSCKVKHTKKKW
jgi:hypothetical protein